MTYPGDPLKAAIVTHAKVSLNKIEDWSLVWALHAVTWELVAIYKVLHVLWLTVVCLFCRLAISPGTRLLLCFLSLSQSATAMATPASATLTWLCT